MPINHSSRPALFIIIIVCSIVFFFVFGPFLLAGFDKQLNISNIKRHQDPEELRAWASHLIAVYSASNFIPGQVTNRPPSGIPTSGRFPEVFIQRAPENGPYHIVLIWGVGVANWGMDIGDTNYVSGFDRKTEWKPGIYFSY